MAPLIKTSLTLLSLSLSLVSAASPHQPAAGHHGKHLKLAKRTLFEGLGKREEFAPYGYDRCASTLCSVPVLTARTDLVRLFTSHPRLACNLRIPSLGRALVVRSRDTSNVMRSLTLSLSLHQHSSTLLKQAASLAHPPTSAKPALPLPHPPNGLHAPLVNQSSRKLKPTLPSQLPLMKKRAQMAVCSASLLKLKLHLLHLHPLLLITATTTEEMVVYSDLELDLQITEMQL